MNKELTQITPKQQAWLKMSDTLSELKSKQNELLARIDLKHYDTIQGIQPLDQDIGSAVAIYTLLKESRIPITKMLDDLKYKTMLAEKEATARINAMKENLLELKKDLAKQEAEAKAKLEADRKSKLEDEEDRINAMAEFAREMKTLIDKAVESWPAPNWSLDDYIEAVEGRIIKLPNGEPEDYQDACDIFRNALHGKIEGLDSGKITDAIIEKVEVKKEEAAISQVLEAQSVDDIKLVETKDLKHVYELDMPDDEATCRAILIAWLKYFNDVTSGLRNRSMMSVRLDQVVTALCKLRQDQEIDGLVFKVVDKL